MNDAGAETQHQGDLNISTVTSQQSTDTRTARRQRAGGQHHVGTRDQGQGPALGGTARDLVTLLGTALGVKLTNCFLLGFSISRFQNAADRS